MSKRRARQARKAFAKRENVDQIMRHVEHGLKRDAKVRLNWKVRGLNGHRYSKPSKQAKQVRVLKGTELQKFYKTAEYCD